MILSLLVLIIFLFYTTLLVSITFGWMRLPAFYDNRIVNITKVSVVIAVRNEAKNMETLLKKLVNQDYKPDLLEIILVNDHSEDTTEEIFNGFTANYNGPIKLKIVSLSEKEGYGKKEALHAGITASTGELILVTDADCKLKRTWVKTMASYFERYNPMMILGPVMMTNDGSFFGRMQSLEFLSLIASGAGSCTNKKPLLANGANIAFTRKAYDACSGYSTNRQHPSGDDMFLMLGIKRKFGAEAIRFIRGAEALVETPAEMSWRAFWEQRKRWVSKSRGYKDSYVVFVSLIVFLTNCSLVLLGILGFASAYFAKEFFILYALKLAADYPLLLSANKFMGRKRIFWLVPFMEILNAIYTSAIGIAGNFGKYSWKGRIHL